MIIISDASSDPYHYQKAIIQLGIKVNRKKIIFLMMILFGLQLAYAQPATIQRYAWVGGNADGTIVALMLSHFGPSSQAPFAKLIVKEAGKPTLLFVDSAMKSSGGEKELSELGLYLVNKNSEKLKSFGITLSNVFLSEANIVTLPNQDPNLASGWVDLENHRIDEFSVKSYLSDTCSKKSVGIAITIERNGMHQLTSKPSEDECWNDSFLLRNIFRTKKALWFILYMHAYGLENEDTYWIDAQGIPI